MKKSAIISALCCIVGLIIIITGIVFIKNNEIQINKSNSGNESSSTVFTDYESSGTAANKSEITASVSSSEDMSEEKSDTDTIAVSITQSSTTAVSAKTTKAKTTAKKETSATTEKASTAAKTTTVAKTYTVSTVDNTPASQATSSSAVRFYYDRLNSGDKAVYNAAREAVESGKLTFTLSTVYSSNIQSGLYAFIYDYPEYCNLRTGYTSSTKGNTVTISIYTYDFCKTADGGGYNSKVINQAKFIASQASAYSSAFDQIKYVHDWLCSNVTYDTVGAKKSDSAKTSTEQTASSAYGAIMNKKALCGGYSSAFALIMHELGYECGYVGGTANGGRHAWNVIKIENEYYYMDVTFDDPDESDMILYYYFCATSSDIDKDHSASRDYSMPKATAVKYNFYYHYGYVLDSYDLDDAKAVLNKQSGNKYLHIKFTTSLAYNSAMNDSKLPAYVRKLKNENTCNYYYRAEVNAIMYN